MKKFKRTRRSDIIKVYDAVVYPEYKKLNHTSRKTKKIVQHYITYDIDKIVWGIGKNEKESKSDAIKNIKDYYYIEPKNCINDRILDISFSEIANKKITLIAQKELIKSFKLKTTKSSTKLYDYIIDNGGESFDCWRIKNGEAVLNNEKE